MFKNFCTTSPNVVEPSPYTPPALDSSSSRAFQRHQEHDLKHPSSVDLITTKQNKLPSFIDSGFHNHKTKQTTFLHRRLALETPMFYSFSFVMGIL